MFYLCSSDTIKCSKKKSFRFLIPFLMATTDVVLHVLVLNILYEVLHDLLFKACGYIYVTLCWERETGTLGKLCYIS